jgi:hypothetical protein
VNAFGKNLMDAGLIISQILLEVNGQAVKQVPMTLFLFHGWS